VLVPCCRNSVSVSVSWQPDKYIVHAEVPGVKKDEIKLSVENGQPTATTRSFTPALSRALFLHTAAASANAVCFLFSFCRCADRDGGEARPARQTIIASHGLCC